MENEAGKNVVFDVFLSHNSKDKPAVRRLALALQRRGITVWRDIEQLEPGGDSQKGLEDGIRASKTAAVLVGKDGLGPWQAEEMKAILQLAVRHKKKLIPVLLPGAPTKPKLPLFVTNRTWLDLREGLTRKGIDNLIWGITGTQPQQSSKVTSAKAEPKQIVPHKTPCDRPPRAQAGKLFGRDAQLDDLLGRLSRRESACVWGPAGFGKTALAAETIYCLLAKVGDDLGRSPFPGGIVLLDLYQLSEHGKRPWDQIAEQAWHTLADRFDPAQPADQPGRDRATRACAGRQALVVVEGAEEAGDSKNLTDLLSVLDGASTRLVLTRNKAQCALHDSIQVAAELETPDALALLRTFVKDRAAKNVLTGVLEVLGGHPLALTWAGRQLELAEEPPTLFLKELEDKRLPGLHDPGYEKHTLKWLYDRSVRMLSEDGPRVLAAAGLLAAAPFDMGAAIAALRDAGEPKRQETESRAGEALKQLVRHGLLRVVANEERWEFTHALAVRFAGSEAVADTGLLRALCRWVLDTFEAGAGHFRRTSDLSRLQGGLLHAAALLARDETGEAADRLATWLLYGGQDLFFSLGRLGYARDALTCVEGWMRHQPAEKQADPNWSREFASLQAEFGFVQTAQGNLPGAQKSYEHCHTICEQLAKKYPGNQNWQRNLSVSQERLGDVQLAQGDLVEARASYEQSRRIRETLSAGDPANAEWQRDLSVGLNKLGDVQLAQGDMVGARASYEQSQKIRETLSEGDRTNTQCQRDLSVSLEKLGDVQLAQGDMAGARASYEQSREIRETLSAGDQTNAQWQRDLSISLIKLGDVQRAQGDLSGALAGCEQARRLFETLSAGDLTNAEWQRDLSVSLEKLGDVQLAQGDLAGAQASYEQSRKIREKLTAGDPTNARWQRDLSYVLTRLAEIAEKTGRHAEASHLAEASLAITERLASLDPTNATWRKDVEISRALVARLRGRHRRSREPPRKPPSTV